MCIRRQPKTDIYENCEIIFPTTVLKGVKTIGVVDSDDVADLLGKCKRQRLLTFFMIRIHELLAVFFLS